MELKINLNEDEIKQAIAEYLYKCNEYDVLGTNVSLHSHRASDPTDPRERDYIDAEAIVKMKYQKK